MKVFLTGGTGFLGSHVAEVLCERGHEVLALVRRTSRRAHLESLGVRLHEGTLEEPETLSSALGECDGVAHVAGLVKAVRPSDFYRVNEEGVGGLTRAAARYARGNRFVLISSIAAQGPGDTAGERSESLSESPVTEYGRSKLAGERAMAEVKEGLNTTILRPPIIYGPREIEFLRVFQAAKKLGIMFCLERRQLLSLIHGRDCANAVVDALETGDTPKEMYLMDDGGTYTWPDIAALLSKVLGRRVRVVTVPRAAMSVMAWTWQSFGRVTGTPVVMSLDKVHEAEARYWVAGNTAITRDLGWEPGFGLEAGMRDAIEWARSEGKL